MTRSVETETKGLGLSKEFTTGSVETETEGLGLSKGFSRVWVKKYNNYSSCSSPTGLCNQATRWHRRRERDLFLLRSEVMQF